ncbi:MAG: hypothetical protein EHM91_07565 [Planctomycetota bacterium]|nr:MAG: hypothetical protein EHM91_07565 [Planctomycetota bacterium]
MNIHALLAACVLFTQSTPDSNPGHLKMGLVNLKSIHSASGNPDANKANLQANLKRHLYFIDKLAAEGVEFIGFPELSINGYNFS